MTSLWHPFSDMGAVESTGEFVLARGEGVHVWDTDDRRYLDATAGLWFTNVGHGRVELAEAAARQMRTLAAYSTFGDYANLPALELAERLEAIAPVPGSKVFLTSGGSDSVDTAAKMARRYWVEQGRPDALPAWAERGGVVVDYFQVPDAAVAPGWPTVVDNSRGLQRFVFRGMRDYLRKVSTHASIGAAFQGEKNFNSWFVLCRD